MDIVEEMNLGQSILEQINPVFNTAKMTLYSIADYGNKDAAAIFEKLGLTREETQNSQTTVASSEQMTASTIMMEIRFRTMSALAEKAGCDFCVDLPCGYTPRAIEFARKNIPFIGMDLPAAIAEAEPVIMSLLNDEEKKLVRFRGVDATNYASLEAALEGIEGSLCITTEGLMMYFTESEVQALCSNIRRILSKHGGCWITPDPESARIYFSVVKAVSGDRFYEIMMNSKQQAADKSDVTVGKNPLVIIRPDSEDDIKAAMTLLSKHGLKAERIAIDEYIPDLMSLSRIEHENAGVLKEEMKKCFFWKITVSEESSTIDTSDVAAEAFGVSAEISGGTMFLSLKGRLDTISAPNLLAFYQKNNDQIKGIHVDCGKLDYISSAGLRVLLMMHKGSENGVVISGMNNVVREILEQTGFDQMLHIE